MTGCPRQHEQSPSLSPSSSPHLHLCCACRERVGLQMQPMQPLSSPARPCGLCCHRFHRPRASGFHRGGPPACSSTSSNSRSGRGKRCSGNGSNRLCAAGIASARSGGSMTSLTTATATCSPPSPPHSTAHQRSLCRASPPNHGGTQLTSRGQLSSSGSRPSSKRSSGVPSTSRASTDSRPTLQWRRRWARGGLLFGCSGSASG
mmetsp:Transcript_10163/g.24609  ORF Transcript_10163/g.24609 Transcript_10163/m.24609 type:complete len:204 (+) Transcript_10163:47-658(+)